LPLFCRAAVCLAAERVIGDKSITTVWYILMEFNVLIPAVPDSFMP